MYIKRIEAQDRKEYEALSSQYGNVFSRLWWLDIFGNAVEIYGIYNTSGNLIGGFDLYKEKCLGFTVYRNCPFTPYIGPFLKVEANNIQDQIGIRKEALSKLVEFIKGSGFSVVSIALGRDVLDVQPFLWHKFKASPAYTYILDLSQDITQLRKNISANRINHMHKAERSGIVVERVTDLSIIYQLAVKTFSRKRLIFNKTILNRIISSQICRNNSFAFAAFKDGIAISASLCIFDRDTSYNILRGHDTDSKYRGASELVMLASIEYAKGLGSKYFDFEGSMVPEIESYFRGFGGSLSVYYKINKAKLPLEILLKFYRRELF